MCLYFIVSESPGLVFLWLCVLPCDPMQRLGLASRLVSELWLHQPWLQGLPFSSHLASRVLHRLPRLCPGLGASDSVGKVGFFQAIGGHLGGSSDGSPRCADLSREWLGLRHGRKFRGKSRTLGAERLERPQWSRVSEQWAWKGFLEISKRSGDTAAAAPKGLAVTCLLWTQSVVVACVFAGHVVGPVGGRRYSSK